MAASEKVWERPRLPPLAANHAMSLSNQISKEPRAFSAALYADQLVVRYFGGAGLVIRCWSLVQGAGLKQLPCLIYATKPGNLTPSLPMINPLQESWFAWLMKTQLLKPAYIAVLKGHV